MYPWLTRVARVLMRVLGVSALLAGAALVVWLAASVLSSPTASAQVLPPSGAGSSSSSSSTKHSSKTSSKAPSKTSNKSSTKVPSKPLGPKLPAKKLTENANARVSHAPQMAQEITDSARAAAARKPAAPKAAPKKAPVLKTSRKAPSKPLGPKLSGKKLSENANARVSHTPQMAQEITDSARAAAAKKAAIERNTPRYQKLLRNANARLSHTPQIAQQLRQASQQAHKAAVAKQNQNIMTTIRTGFPASGPFSPPAVQAKSSPYPAAFAREDAEARDRRRVAKAAAAQAAEVDRWMAHHPYAAAVLAANTNYSSANLPSGSSLSNDLKHYQEMADWVMQENEVINPDGRQGGGPMYEEYAARLFAQHRRGYFPGDPIINVDQDVLRSKAPPAVKKMFNEELEARSRRLEKGEAILHALDGLAS